MTSSKITIGLILVLGATNAFAFNFSKIEASLKAASCKKVKDIYRCNNGIQLRIEKPSYLKILCRKPFCNNYDYEKIWTKTFHILDPDQVFPNSFYSLNLRVLKEIREEKTHGRRISFCSARTAISECQIPFTFESDNGTKLSISFVKGSY